MDGGRSAEVGLVSGDTLPSSGKARSTPSLQCKAAWNRLLSVGAAMAGQRAGAVLRPQLACRSRLG